MEHIINFFKKTINHIIRNASNYLLLIGVLFILTFIYMTFGIAPSFLFIGIVLSIVALIVELNKEKKEKQSHQGFR